MLDTRDKDGGTSLHWAAMLNENPAVVFTLIKARADPKTRAANGKTAWDLIQKNEKRKGSDAYW